MRSRSTSIILASAVLGLAAFVGCWDRGQATEVVATKEWTLLGENDTIAAGMHVRIDLEKGERWVKIPEEEGDDGAIGVTADGGMVLSETAEKTNNEEYGLKYDFEMMHRTLSQLPQEEKDSMELPDLPEGGTVESLRGTQRVEFETKMKKIWELRQEQLKAFEEHNVADLPEILKARIQSINEYLLDPYQGLVSIKLEGDDEDSPSHIVSILEDLEFLLSDVDMARDFHTLGGWPVLASLLSDRVHISVNHTLAEDVSDKVHAVQALAAWALGTAVKNTGEFAPYAIELVLVGDEKTTALDLLLHQMTSGTPNSFAVWQKEQKIVYAIGAMLRGNRRAQIHFCAETGPSLLGKRLEGALSDGSSGALKLAKRLLTLADDIVLDIALHAGTSEQIDAAIAKAFADEVWCASVLQAFDGEFSLQQSAISAARGLSDLCSWDPSVFRESLEIVRIAWSDAGVEQDVEQALLDLIGHVAEKT